MLRLPFYSPDDGDPAGGTPPEPPKVPKTFSEDYVQALREENKNHRLAHKATVSTLRSILGLKDDEDPTEERITAWRQEQQKSLEKVLTTANARLIAAEIKTFASEYDVKLLDRLLDRSKIKVEEDGSVTGLKEAIAELEKDFPSIRKPPAQGAPPNPPPPGSKTVAQEIAEVKELLRKNPNDREQTERLFRLKEKARGG